LDMERVRLPSTKKGRVQLEKESTKGSPMAKRGFGVRRNELEEKYFGEHDQKLLRAMRDEAAMKAKKAALKNAVGIADDELVEQLHELEMCHETVPALSLVPLIFVAWADGVVRPNERNVILAAADEEGLDEKHPCCDVLQRWLKDKPNPRLLEVWQRYVTQLSKTLDADTFQSLKEKALRRSRAVAKAAGGIFGLGNKITKAERAVLSRLEQAFG